MDSIVFILDAQEIGLRIKALREALGLSQSAVAAKVSCTMQAVSKWERGESLPSLSRLGCLARVLGTTTDYLIGLSKDHFTDGSRQYQEENGPPPSSPDGSFLKWAYQAVRRMYHGMIRLFTRQG